MSAGGNLGQFLERPALRVSHALQEPGIHVGGRPGAGSGHWGKHRHLQRFQRDALATVARQKCQAARGCGVQNSRLSVSAQGIEPALGRTFAPDEGWVQNKDPLVVLSYKYWQKRFGGDRSIVGQTVQVNNHAFTIIGVAPEKYIGAYYFIEPDLYLPISTLGLLDPTQSDVLTKRSAAFLRVLGYLQPGVTPAQAMAAAQPIDQRLAQDFPDSHKGLSLLVLPELSARPEPGLGGFMSTAVIVFMLLVGLVLLIACANVANLILARANGRRKEFATRVALGASRWRMARQLLTETVLLSAFGGILGMVFARWAGMLLTSIHIPSD